MDNKKGKHAIAFFVVLTVLSVISFIIPLRPKVSYGEKRELKKFPEITVQALWDGSYFKEISLWYSDTFPGRERWLEASQVIASFHGSGSIAIEGELPEYEPVPEIPVPTKPLATSEEMVETTESKEDSITTEEETAASGEPESSEAEAEEDGEILLDAVISSTSIVQVGDAAYQPLGFSQMQSDRYARILTAYADAVEPLGVRVVSAPPPIAIGTKLPAEYLPKLRSSDPRETLAYMHGSMGENVITVDTQAALDPHKEEYLFFRTDHHWTALAAYYCYQAVCQSLGMEPAELEDFEVLDQGEFCGTLYGRARYPYKLTKDNVISYIPSGNITLTVYGKQTGQREGQVVRDLRKEKNYSKYLCFLEGDQPLVLMENYDMPEDAGNCIIIKDSFGNCFVPFFSQNYRKVYAMDYRKYEKGDLKRFVETYEIQDVIFAPNLMSTQSSVGINLLSARCGFRF